MKRLLMLASLAVALLTVRQAGAHVTAFIDHHDDMPLENATPYPVPGTLEPLFALNGFLYTPGQVDYLTFEANEGDNFTGFTVDPLKNGARDFSPNFALIGPGLPALKGSVPFTVPPEMGAQVFETPKERDISDEQFGYGALLEGPQHSVLLPATGRYYVAIYDPEGKLGHYILSVGTSEDETLIPNLQDFSIPKFGDLTGDDKVDRGDVTLVLQSIVHKANLTSRQRFSADVGPIGDTSTQISPGDGAIDIGDASRLLRYADGLDGGDQWPF